MRIETIAKRLGREPYEFMRRLDGRIEWVCMHGIGHTVWFPLGGNGVHGCDGCCKKLRKVKE